MSETDREVLFSNEAFVIGMLQAVSGGSVVAALSQLDALVNNAGRTSFLVFLTAMAVGLASAVLAAYWKHQYKLWDVKAGTSLGRASTHRAKGNLQDAEAEEAEGRERGKKSSRFLSAMRSCMAVAVLAVLFAIGQLVFAFWTTTPAAPNKVLQDDARNARA